jgi:P27 family predicted phage terminase small subunit
MQFSVLNERGIEVYNTCKAFLEEHDLWNDIDVYILESYAFNCQESERLAAEINKEGLVIQYTNKGGHCNTVINPKLKIYHEFCGLRMKVATQFGFTPLARKKLKLEQKRKKKGFDFDDI